jgi:hypothetical protein
MQISISHKSVLSQPTPRQCPNHCLYTSPHLSHVTVPSNPSPEKPHIPQVPQGHPYSQNTPPAYRSHYCQTYLGVSIHPSLCDTEREERGHNIVERLAVSAVQFCDDEEDEGEGNGVEKVGVAADCDWGC